MIKYIERKTLGLENITLRFGERDERYSSMSRCLLVGSTSTTNEIRREISNLNLIPILGYYVSVLLLFDMCVDDI